MNEDEFLQKSRQLLDESAQQLDAHTLSRLNQARQRAIDSRLHSRRFGLAIPATATAVVTIAVVSGWLWMPHSPVPQQPQIAMEDMEIISSDTELELLEDLDFIAWLAEEDHAG